MTVVAPERHPTAPIDWKIPGKWTRVALVDTPKRVLVDPRMTGPHDRMVRVVVREENRWAVREERMGIGLLGYLPPDLKHPEHCVVTNHRVLRSGDVMVSLRRAPVAPRVPLRHSNWSTGYPQSLQDLRIPRAQRPDRLRVDLVQLDPAGMRALVVVDTATGHSVGMVPPPMCHDLTSWLSADQHYGLWVGPDWHISPAPAIEVRLLPIWVPVGPSGDADDS
jgi:hypothetical protein